MFPELKGKVGHGLDFPSKQLVGIGGLDFPSKPNTFGMGVAILSTIGKLGIVP